MLTLMFREKAMLIGACPTLSVWASHISDQQRPADPGSGSTEILAVNISRSQERTIYPCASHAVRNATWPHRRCRPRPSAPWEQLDSPRLGDLHARDLDRTAALDGCGADQSRDQTAGRRLESRLPVDAGCAPRRQHHDLEQSGPSLKPGASSGVASGLEAVKAQGLDTIRGAIAQLAPFLADRTGEIRSFDDFKQLTVGVDRLIIWHKPGVLCIGDAAHAMSPIGGVGINLAVQDAVAAANILARPLREGRLTDADLAAVQTRRLWPTQIVQGLQVQIQKRVISGVLGSTRQPDPPLPLRLIARYPVLARIPARLLGLGYRRERVMGARR